MLSILRRFLALKVWEGDNGQADDVPLGPDPLHPPFLLLQIRVTKADAEEAQRKVRLLLGAVVAEIRRGDRATCEYSMFRMYRLGTWVASSLNH